MPTHRHAILAIALCLGVLLLVGTLEYQRRQSPAAATVPSARAEDPGLLNVTNAVQSLKLVTWQFDTAISARSVSDKWYGDAVASVQAPVRYQYGVDLGRLRREDVFFSSGGEGYVFLVPAPERIAVEVDLENLEERLRVSGARWRSNNHSELDAARKKLAESAREMRLSPEDAQRLREVSRQQLETHLTNVLTTTGVPDARLTIRFVED